jgi:hypothetical protein
MGGVDHGEPEPHGRFPEEDHERFPEEDLVPSPGGWTAPAGGRPGWDLFPPCGATPVPERTAWWIRALYRTPFLDRYAHQLMWERGGFLVLPPAHPWFRLES